MLGRAGSRHIEIAWIAPLRFIAIGINPSLLVGIFDRQFQLLRAATTFLRLPVKNDHISNMIDNQI